MSNTYTVLIGYDPKEAIYTSVLKSTLHKLSKSKLIAQPIVQKELRKLTLYYRKSEKVNGQNIDVIDGKPFSTEFSFTRFLTPVIFEHFYKPYIENHKGLVLFMDCDMYARTDIAELFETFPMDKAIGCVKHDYNPTSEIKMDGVAQTRYFRKNWSSLMMFNCNHEANKSLDVTNVNYRTGSWLHSFTWLDEPFIGKPDPDQYNLSYGESLIHGFDHKWNWLDGHSDPSIDPAIVHFTTGGPVYPNWRPSRDIDGVYADEWERLSKAYTGENTQS
jgi:hypothetical protein